MKVVTVHRGVLHSQVQYITHTTRDVASSGASWQTVTLRGRAESKYFAVKLLTDFTGTTFNQKKSLFGNSSLCFLCFMTGVMGSETRTNKTTDDVQEAKVQKG